MRRFIIEQTETYIISHARLGSIGMALNERNKLSVAAKAAAHTFLAAMADQADAPIALTSPNQDDSPALTGVN